MDNTTEEVYYILNGYIYIFDIKTNIQVKDEFEPIIINDVTVSENLSMKFKYILGSLNFMLNETISTESNSHKKQNLTLKIIKLLLKITGMFDGNTNLTDIEEKINQIDAERMEFKLILT
ncbi:hypothetical protein [Flavobacterium sp.]|uniref:hypothetical protein n=1 Tax=Flavobacterium sp. TaxID=239 RepID=UPI003D6A21F4